MTNLLGVFSIIIFTSSLISIESAAMTDQVGNLSTIVIQKFKPEVKKWRSYVQVNNRCAGKISPLHEEMLRKNFSKTKAHFFHTILINEKSIIHHTIDKLGLVNSDVNFEKFRLALKSQREYISAINFYGVPLGFYALVKLYSDEQLIIDVLHELFQHGVSVNHNYGDGERLLDAAIANNRVQVVKYLLQKGATPNAIYDSGARAPLHAAYSECNVEIIQLLLAFGADSEVFDEDGYTLLHQACLKNQYQLANLLLSYKADPESQDIFGNMPIDYALAYQNQAGKKGILFQLLMDFTHKKSPSNKSEKNSK